MGVTRPIMGMLFLWVWGGDACGGGVTGSSSSQSGLDRRELDRWNPDFG
jgi:hypothetical protein